MLLLMIPHFAKHQPKLWMVAINCVVWGRALDLHTASTHSLTKLPKFLLRSRSHCPADTKTLVPDMSRYKLVLARQSPAKCRGVQALRWLFLPGQQLPFMTLSPPLWWKQPYVKKYSIIILAVLQYFLLTGILGILYYTQQRSTQLAAQTLIVVAVLQYKYVYS